MGSGNAISMEKDKSMTSLKTSIKKSWHYLMGKIHENNICDLCIKKVAHGIHDLKDSFSVL